ncbi:hypothetical protein TNCV_4540851 [Trichonephila clavipes]|nr:hypothetical protein TNCV_4540851 [Trichonephila clavipes]
MKGRERVPPKRFKEVDWRVAERSVRPARDLREGCDIKLILDVMGSSFRLLGKSPTDDDTNYLIARCICVYLHLHRKLKDRERRVLKRMDTRNHKTTLPQIMSEMNVHLQKPESMKIIQRELHAVNTHGITQIFEKRLFQREML